jgi:hypothetical protein
LQNEIHDPFHKFQFTTGRQTEEESFDFRFAFGIFDTALNPISPPPDLARFGKWSVKLRQRLFDPELGSIVLVDKQVSYHPCTVEDVQKLGD